MPVNTEAINTILQAYLAGRGIRERREAEVTRQKERGEDIKRAEEHYNVQRQQAEAQFNLNKAIAEMNQRESIARMYKESGILPTGSELQGTMWEDETGTPQEMPVYREYSYPDLEGKQQRIQLPNPQYQGELAIRLAEEKQRRETTAQESAQEPFDIRKFQREKNYELSKMPLTEAEKAREAETAHGYRMEEIAAQGRAQESLRLSLKQEAEDDLLPLAQGAIINPEILDTITADGRLKVQNLILKHNLQWSPPAVKASYDRLTKALQEIESIEKIPGYIGFGGQIARNIGGTQTNALNLAVTGLKNTLLVDRLKFMRGLGHMSDNDVRILEGSLGKLDIQNARFKEVLAETKKTVQDAITELQKRNAAQPVTPVIPGGSQGTGTGGRGRRPLGQIIP